MNDARRRAAAICVLVAVPLLAWAAGRGAASPPILRIDPDLGVTIGEPLLSAWTETAPAMDGQIEAVWKTAPVLSAPLHDGLHGKEPAGSVELRALHDDRRVYFLAQWSAGGPGGEPGGVEPELLLRNLATVHWRLVDSGKVSGASTGSEGLACTVACHTATANGSGELAGMRAETIPPGFEEDLPSGGGWSDGMWTLEWSRSRRSDNPYDQDLIDPKTSYRFFVKLFLGQQGRPDPVSDVHELRLEQ